MIAYHGNAEIKEKYLRRVRQHQEADEILQGYGYWSEGKGCAVGCVLHSGDHSEYERQLGIPVELALLQDGLFERLPEADAKQFPLRFLDAIPVGADLSRVINHFLHWLLIDPDHGCAAIVRQAGYSGAVKAIEDVAALHYRVMLGEAVSEEEWDAAWAASSDAARDARGVTGACYAAARDARDVTGACYAAAAAVRAASWDAAWAASSDAAWGSTWDARYEATRRQMGKLLELLAAAPVGER